MQFDNKLDQRSASFLKTIRAYEELRYAGFLRNTIKFIACD